MTPDLPGIGPVWLVGCGNMGGALLARWIASGLRDVTVIDPHAGAVPHGIVPRAGPPPGSPSIIVLAIKPQIWRDAVVALTPAQTAGAVIVSIMAGVATDALAARFPDSPVVRTMPNTPARIGQGVTALFAAGASASERAAVEALMAAAGDALWLDDESDFDAVTAVSGSGPAYVFAFIEALAAAGEAAGLAPGLAARLALGTVGGAAALAALREASPEALRIAVTSPNGTTEAGLGVLRPALGPVLRETVAAAQRRSRELGQPG